MIEQQGMMDMWITHTWNPLGGRCGHVCAFCYVPKIGMPAARSKYAGRPRLHCPAMRENLGSERSIFVCDCNDLFADNVPRRAPLQILERCREFSDNWYHFRTKQPANMEYPILPPFPKKTILGVSIETTQATSMTSSGLSYAPAPIDRAMLFAAIDRPVLTMVALEPLLKFDLNMLVDWIERINPHFATVGVDSKGFRHPYGEPENDEIWELVYKLSRFCDVIPKPTLSRVVDDFADLCTWIHLNNSRIFIDCLTLNSLLTDDKKNFEFAMMDGYQYLESLAALESWGK